MPDVARKVFKEELEKLQGLEPDASEANVMRNYFPWLTQVHGNLSLSSSLSENPFSRSLGIAICLKTVKSLTLKRYSMKTTMDLPM